MKTFEKNDIVVHSGIPGKKMVVLEQINPTQYKIIDMEIQKLITNKDFSMVCTIDNLFKLDEMRDKLINFILDYE